MGQWVIVIEGTGCHHNGQDYDAEVIAKSAVDHLTSKGHTIQHASFTAGGREVIDLNGERRPEK